MSAIVGVVAFKKFFISEEIFIDIERSMLKRGYGFEFKKSKNYFMFNVKNYDNRSKKYIAEIGNYVLNFDGRIDNKEEVIRKFRLKKNINEAEICISIYKEFGEKSLNTIIGAFVLIIFDKNKNEIVCYRDQLGIRPLYYSYDNDVFIYATEPKFIFKIKKLEKTINHLKLRNFLIGVEDEPSMTYYKNIQKIPRGSKLEITESSKKISKYFEFKRNPYRFKDNLNFTEIFFENFSNAIKMQIPNEERIGTALSGGLDSSSVTGMLASINKKFNLNKDIHSFSYRFINLKENDFKGTDEIKYVNDAINMGDINPVLIDIESTNVVKDLLESQSSFPEPCLHGNRYLELKMIEACKSHKVNTLFTGYDGDCTISYGMENIQSLLDKNKFLKAISINNEVRNKIGLKSNVVNMILMYVLVKRLPLAFHFLIKKLKGLERFSENHKFLSSNLIKDIDYKETLKDIREKQFNYKESHQRLLNSHSFSNNFEALDIDYSYNDIEERHPFCNHRFMQFCLDLPLELKLKNGMTRYILRESMKEIIPKSIYSRMTKSNLSPYFIYSFDGMRNDLFENLIYSKTEIRPLLNIENLKRMSQKTILTNNEKSYIVSYNCVNEWLKANQ